MTKTWEKLTQSEKIEDLRNDLQRLFSVVNVMSSDLGKASEVATAVEELKKKFPEAPGENH